MAEIMKAYKQSVPAMRFIGRKYSDSYAWDEWFEKDLFGELERAAGGEKAIPHLYEDGDAYIGMIHISKEFQTLEYWIGEFFATGTEVPEGFLSIDYPAQNFGVCWIYGENISDILSQSGRVAGKLAEANMEVIYEDDGSFWCFERYGCPRYTSPDEKGNIILDYCFFVK